LRRQELAARLELARRVLAMRRELQRRTEEAKRMQAELRHQNERLAELVATDVLTGLSNRRHFMEALESQTALACRREEPLSVIMVDVDEFKRYNDVFGHRAGDEAIRKVGALLRTGVRGSDLVARYGGEELVVLMPGADVSAGREVAERLRGLIAEAFWPLRPVTASFGVATREGAGLVPSALVEEADRALYQSKARGRNCVTHYVDLISDPLPVGGPR
jgi:diguanylate cyclase (GGDEF)-like protein